jgi:hypothetical protein
MPDRLKILTIGNPLRRKLQLKKHVHGNRLGKTFEQCQYVKACLPISPPHSSEHNGTFELVGEVPRVLEHGV